MDYRTIEYIIYFDYAAFIIMIALIVSYYMMKHLENVQNRMLRIMLFTHLIVIVTDIVNVIGQRYGGIPYGVLYASHFLYFILHTATVFAFFFYCCCLTDQYGYGKPLLQILVCAPMVLCFLLLITNHWTQWIFYVDDELMYHRGPAILIIYLIAAFYIGLALFFLGRYKEYVSKVQRSVSYTYIGLSVVSVAIQYFFPIMLVESFGVTVALMVLFFSTARFSELYDEVYNVLNKRAFMSMIESSLHWLDTSYIVFVKVHDVQLFRLALGKEFQRALIRKIIEYLKKEYKDCDVFHYSNSQFVLMARKHVSEKRVDEIVEALNQKFHDVWQVGENEIRCSYHVGKFVCGNDQEIFNPEKLKECLEYVNNYSRAIDNNILTVKDMKVGAVARTLLVQKLLEEAVEQNGFEMYYQPIYSVKEKKVISGEALIRLKNTEHGFISPEEFIPIAEQNGLIMRIGEFAFRAVCEFIKNHEIDKYGIRFIEVNLSVVQCMQEKLHRQLLEIMSEYGVEPNKINLEITETAEATRMGAFQDNMYALKDKGIGFSLDDYGTGYSNLSFLYGFPFSIIKMDKSLLWGAFENEKAMITLMSSIELAKKLDLQVVVEGVETEEHLNKLVELGCEYLQGYYFSKPIPGEEFLKYVAEMEEAKCRPY